MGESSRKLRFNVLNLIPPSADCDAKRFQTSSFESAVLEQDFPCRRVQAVSVPEQIFSQVPDCTKSALRRHQATTHRLPRAGLSPL